MTHRFLFELLCEEIPVGEQKRFTKDVPSILEKLLVSERIEHTPVKSYTTPRRLTLFCDDMSIEQKSIKEELSGPPVAIAFKDGEPTKAALGFAKKCGKTIDELHRITKGNREFLGAWNIVEGVNTIDVMPQLLQKLINKIPFRKSMRWGDTDFSFSRPIRGILALLGKDSIKFESHNILSSRKLYGHRFFHPKGVNLKSANDYETVLCELGVTVDTEKRLSIIKEEVLNVAEAENLDLIVDEGLFQEVVLLVENPTVVLGSFDPDFLKIPKEAVLSAMRKHQRYFAFKKDGQLAPRFATVLGTRVNEPKVALDGNERVLSARLSDAQFFYETDLQHPLESHKSHMETMIYHKKLGTLWDKIDRIVQLSEFIASKAGANVDLVKRAAFLCKMDLDTHMVNEFPELQGLMGERYANLQGEDPAVAKAIFEHYLPRFSDDVLPSTTEGKIVAMADRLDHITGGIGAGLKPTGSADPFALRRAALGLLRIIIEGKIDYSLGEMVEKNLSILPVTPDKKEVVSFLTDRFRTILLKKAPKEMVEAVLASKDDHPVALMKKLDAILEISESESFISLVKLFKRMNILKKADNISTKVDTSCLDHPSEKALHDALISVENNMEKHLTNQNYKEVLNLLVPLWKVVDDFFDDKKGVRIMDDDIAIRTNRLALLAFLDKLFRKVADFKLLAGLK
jgi:glycyl-tRNA synthetase beta chain